MAQATTETDKALQAARFVERENYYLQAQPDFAAHAFIDEMRIAFDPQAPTGFTVLDHRAALECEWPATTPVMLARYAKLRKGETLASKFTAGGETYYVIAGAGVSSNRGDTIEWQKGDVFCFGGGGATRHAAGADDCLLWVVTDEPLQAFLGVQASDERAHAAGALHFRAAAIDKALAAAQQRELAKGSASNGNAAFIFSSDTGMVRRCLPFPALMLALNSLPAGSSQRPHRHNSVALTLVLSGDQCHSMIAGARHDWHTHAAIVTPPGQLHSHHNDGEGVARVLIAQDSGMHYYLRSAGFSYA
ncbi:cupin domain-containing protein [Piscinibacter sakaiensis]|uniref:cupin domain-containing protein n=1 Tax=Piscinibacter sakaiensis TaxID=1547922 RepID=UPI003AAE1F28